MTDDADAVVSYDWLECQEPSFVTSGKTPHMMIKNKHVYATTDIPAHTLGELCFYYYFIKFN